MMGLIFKTKMPKLYEIAHRLLVMSTLLVWSGYARHTKLCTGHLGPEPLEQIVRQSTNFYMATSIFGSSRRWKTRRSREPAIL
jgi:hypothetical protein